MVLHFKVNRAGRGKESAGKILEISGRTEVMVQRALALGRAGFDVTGVVGVETARTLMKEDRYVVVIIGGAVVDGKLLGAVRRLQPKARILAIAAPAGNVSGEELVREVRELNRAAPEGALVVFSSIPPG